MGKKKRRKRKTSHPCELGWRVRWTRKFRHMCMKLLGDRKCKTLLKNLKLIIRDPQQRDRLKREPTVGYYPYKGKRFEVKRLKKGNLRIGFVYREDICRVWFVVILRRTSSTYRRKKWR